MKCPNCYTELPDTATFCYMCKKPIPTANTAVEKHPCPNCGAPLPKTATECYVCHNKFSSGYYSSPSPVIEKENSGVLVGKPYTRLPQNSASTVPRYNAKPAKNENGCIVKVGGTFLVIVIILGLFIKFGFKKENEETSEDLTEISNEITDNTIEKTTQENKSPLDKILASDMKNMKVGEVGKKDNVYFCLVHMKKSNELSHEVASSEYTDEQHEVLFAFVDVYNNSDKVVNVYENKFSCYVDNTKVERMDTWFYVVEDGIKDLNYNDIDPHTSELILLQYEIPKDCNEIKVYYESSCIWIEKYDVLTEEPYDGKRPLMQAQSFDNTPIGSKVYSGKYEMIFDGAEYYVDETFGDSKKYIVFKYTINAVTKTKIPLGHYTRCYQNGYLINSADYILDTKVDDYNN